jgi:Ca2+-binding EF-hand superfamily protein
MKTTLSTCLVAISLLAGTAMAGDPPRSDGAHDVMRADTDGDGRISRAEATAASTERSSEWFDKLDLNKDGFVTQEEMKQARDAHHENFRADMKAKMDERFKEADTNGDGQLSLEEAQAKMPRLAEHFSELDTDKNGMVSKDELANAPHHGRHGQPPQAAPAG